MRLVYDPASNSPPAPKQGTTSPFFGLFQKAGRLSFCRKAFLPGRKPHRVKAKVNSCPVKKEHNPRAWPTTTPGINIEGGHTPRSSNGSGSRRSRGRRWARSRGRSSAGSSSRAAKFGSHHEKVQHKRREVYMYTCMCMG